jgi:hypothetical protein
MSGRPGTNWNGHLPSNRLEREILNAIDGIEDEQGNAPSFMTPGDEPTRVHSAGQSQAAPKAARRDARAAAMLSSMERQAEAVRCQEELRRRNAQVGVDAVASAKPPSDSEEDDDDEAYQRFRMERLQLLQLQAAAAASLPTFGSLEVIDVDDFLDRVDRPGSEQTYVVVHLYESPIAACVRLNFRLSALAKKHDHVRFLACSALACRPHIDVGILPTLVVYRGGEYMADVQRVHDAAGEDMPLDIIEELLRDVGVRLSSAAALCATDTAALQRYREQLSDDDDASEDEDEDD